MCMFLPTCLRVSAEYTWWKMGNTFVFEYWVACCLVWEGWPWGHALWGAGVSWADSDLAEALGSD